MSRALIKVGYHCNNACVFCHTQKTRGARDSDGAVRRKIDRAVELEHSMAVFSGGEPTMRPELLGWADRCVERGLEVGLITNGRMLAYPRLVSDLLGRSLRYVHLSLHGATAAVHDGLVRAEAFEQTLAAIRNLRGSGIEVVVACVVTRQNIDRLGELAALLAGIDERMLLKLSMAEAKGAALDDFERVVPAVTEVAAAVTAVLERAAMPAAHEGIPLCLMRGWEHASVDLRSFGFASMSEVGEPDFFPVDTDNKSFAPACDGCALRGGCPGLFRAYLERRGAKELRPVGGRRSNSFNYTPRRSLTWSHGARCPVKSDGVTPYHRARALFIRVGESMTLHETHTRDFSDDEIAATKLERGQIYVDISEKIAPDDFSRDLRRLRRLEECAACPDDRRCAGCYAIAEEDPFASDDQVLRMLLGELRGAVLDVGCGEGRYLDAFTHGEIQYTGVDPDRDALERLRQRWPWATVRQSSAERFEPEVDSFDHVLVLNSYNHLEEPEPVFERLTAALVPGGTLLVADNIVFGLARTQEQAARAEASVAALEHLRNEDATAVARRLGGLGVEVTRTWNVGPQTSNQWLLQLRRL